MKPILTILSGENAGAKHAIEADRRYIIGRDDQADITLAEKKISRRHATLIWSKETNEVLIEDLNSLNGTYVNEEVIARATVLKDGDRIQIGSFLMEIKVPEDSSVVDLVSASKPLQTAPRMRSTNPAKPEDDDEESLRKTGGRLISGRLEELSLPDLLQMLATTKKSGRLVISKKKIISLPKPSQTTGSDTGSLYLQNGELLHVEFNGMINEEAFFEILPWERGYFALFPHHHFEFHRMVEMPVEALLLEGFRRLDEQRASLIEINSSDVFAVNLDEPLTSLSADELIVFQSAWKHKTASKIWQNSNLEKEVVSQALRTLMKRGFITREA